MDVKYRNMHVTCITFRVGLGPPEFGGYMVHRMLLVVGVSDHNVI